MTDTAENRGMIFNLFTPSRFAVLLAVLVFTSFSQVLLGTETFIARDYGFFAFPLAYFQKQCFWHGEIPIWDPYNNCGVPFLAQWNTMPLYPPSLIYLLLPLTWSLSFFCLLHFWFGGLGMYFLARRWTQNDVAGAFAGTAFSFSGMTMNLLMWPSHTATWSWMPWVILAVECAWRNGGRCIAIAAIAGTLQMLAGGPEIIFFTWSILFALWIVHLVFNDTGATCLSDSARYTGGDAAAQRPYQFPRQMFWRFPAVVTLVAAMSAVQLLPFLDLASHSQRQGGYADLRWSMPGHGWANFFVPMAFGAVRGEGIFFQTGQAWTSSYYLGIAPLLLAILAIWKCRDRRVWLLAAVAVVGVICALGGNTPIFPAFRKLCPQLAFVTYPVKYLLLVTFVAPLLAAFALGQIQKLKREIILFGLVQFCLIAGVLFRVWRDLSPDPGAHIELSYGISRIPFLFLILIGLCALARTPDGPHFRLVALPLLVFVWLDLLTQEPPQNPAVPPGIYQPGLAREQLAMNPQPELGGPRAMVTPKAFMQFIQLALRDPEKNYLAKRLGYCADCNLLDAVPKVDGFFSLYPRENDDLISLIYGATNDFPRLDDFIGVSQITAPDEMFHWLPRTTFLPLATIGQKPFVMDDWNTMHLLANSNFDGSKMVFLAPEDRPFVTLTNPVAGARVVSSAFRNSSVEIEVASPAPTVVVVAQTYYHNWRASVDGHTVPLLRANHAFQAVEVPEGRHDLVLRYVDRAFEIGAVVSGIAWIGCLAGGLHRGHHKGSDAHNADGRPPSPRPAPPGKGELSTDDQTALRRKRPDG